MKKFLFVFLALAIAVATAGTALAAKDTLVVLDQYDPTTLDPIGHNDMPSARACLAIYDQLIRLNADSSLSPGLAESWEYSSDNKDYTFHLRKGVKFHNGEEMKASDVRYSLLRATTDKGAQIKTYSQNVEDVVVVDDYTVIVKTKTADYSFFASLSHNWASVLCEKAVEAAGDNYGMNPIGTGPFKFVEWQKGNRYVLERFDDYWGEKAKMARVEVRSVPEPTNRTIELESGGADVAYPISPVDIKRVEGNDKLQLVRLPQTSVTYMGFNLAKAPFNDPEVRRAIRSALNLEDIHTVWEGVGKVPSSLIPEAIKYSIDKETPITTQDQDAAKKVLEAAGVKEIMIWTNERKERQDMAQIIQAQLDEIGIKSEIRVLEWGAYLSGLQEKTHDVFLLGWSSTVPDPNFAVAGLLETGAGTNYTNTSDAKLDELLQKGRGLPDGEERAALYKEMQLYINELCPMVYLHNDESIVGMQKNVKGFEVFGNENHSWKGAYIAD